MATEAAAAQTNEENRRKLTDAEVVDRWLSNVPDQIRPVLRPLIERVIERERKRCVDLVKAGSSRHAARAQEIEGQIQAAIISGMGVDELAVLRTAEIACARALNGMAIAVSISPGSCSTCHGTKMAPAAVVLSGGQRPLVPCPVCASPPAPVTNGARAADPG